MNGSGPTLSPEDLADAVKRDKSPLLIDVREPEEFDAGHITGALNWPLEAVGNNIAGLEITTEIVFICQSGKQRHYDFLMYAQEDDKLVDGYFAKIDAVALSGEETLQTWKDGLNQEAARLKLPVEYAPDGDVYAAYVSPDFLLETIRNHTAQIAR